MRIVATAGHVDHGKSALVLALTGTDPDRWAEEKERGLTIDLGFAVAELPAGPVAFVDVPGHERFLGNMLAGVGAVDAVLLVVSAVEGWKAQSEEHLAIVELLGVAGGVVALTHADRVDAVRRDEVEQQVRSRLAGGPLAPAEVVATAVPGGAGVPELAAALDRLVRATPPAEDHGRPRLWVDRAFSIRGAGTVVTGTLTGGELEVGQTLVTAPGDRPSRIRSIQVHDQPRETVGPGHRVALNLPGLAPADLGRGVALVEPDRWHPTTTVDATLTVLASAPRPVTRRGAHLLHTGTGSWAVRLQVLGAPSVPPGGDGLVRLRLPVALPLRPGDRYVLRDTGSDATVGGGIVLDLDPLLPPSRARPDRRWERIVAEHGWIDAGRLERLTGVARPPTVGRWVASDDALAAGRADLMRELDAAGPSGLPRSALGERARALVDAGLVPEVVVGGDHVGLVASDDDDGDGHPWLDRLVADLFRPPPPDGIPPAEVAALVRRRLVVRRDGMYFHHRAVPEAVARLESLGAGGFTVAEARTVLATTRRFALPLLAELDARGLTRRVGDLRTLVREG
ncbi:MAG TPA: selenocysteine-specific translation elongation factor [Iamia sp.]|nr:selenocysteine-specific translation elongation factor [Iamia sp.]